jgi:hypothetical protein
MLYCIELTVAYRNRRFVADAGETASDGGAARRRVVYSRRYAFSTGVGVCSRNIRVPFEAGRIWRGLKNRRRSPGRTPRYHSS